MHHFIEVTRMNDVYFVLFQNATSPTMAILYRRPSTFTPKHAPCSHLYVHIFIMSVPLLVPRGINVHILIMSVLLIVPREIKYL